MAKYIDVSKVTIPKGYDFNVPKLLNWLNSQPEADVVSMAVHQQVRWERDIAIEQLAEYGVGFSEKKKDLVEVVRCKDCKHKDDTGYVDNGYVYCKHYGLRVKNDFCSYGERKDNGESI